MTNSYILSLTAVAAHKYVISFCVGLELYNVGTPKLLYAAYTITYAMMSVIGIGIGIGVTSAIEDNEKAYMTTVGVLSVSYFLELEQHCTNRIFTAFCLSLRTFELF